MKTYIFLETDEKNSSFEKTLKDALKFYRHKLIKDYDRAQLIITDSFFKAREILEKNSKTSVLALLLMGDVHDKKKFCDLAETYPGRVEMCVIKSSSMDNNYRLLSDCLAEKSKLYKKKSSLKNRID